MKKISFSALLLAAICSFQACNNNASNTNSADSTRMADSMNNANNNATDTTNKMNNMATTTQNTTPLPKDAQDFVMKAASGGMMEVQLGQLAQQKAQSQRVKDFGQMMVTDHSAAIDELKNLVSSRNVTVPTTLGADEQKEVDKLNGKTGKDFDKDYMNMMVDDHEKDIAEFKKASKNVSDSSIKSFATRTLPTLEKHLDSAQAIKKHSM
ncbi:MAG: DUF4142 domain-containing protein [Chitinophagaceae bacterium]